MDEVIDLEDKINYVKNQKCFRELTTKEIQGLAELWSYKPFKAGDTIVTEGEPVDSVFIILDGKADVRHVTLKDGDTQFQSLATLIPGDAIGLNDTGFYSLSGVRTATVVALTDLSTLQLSTAAFHGYALANSHVFEVMHKNPEAKEAQAAAFEFNNDNGIAPRKSFD